MYRFAEQAEAHVETMNGTIRRLYDEGVVDAAGYLGGILDMTPYAEGYGDGSSQQVTQSALLVPEGLGVVLRDSEEMGRKLSLKEMREKFAPIGVIRPILRLTYLPCATMLLADLEDLIGG